jgi:hypothetical protein
MREAKRDKADRYWSGNLQALREGRKKSCPGWDKVFKHKILHSIYENTW